MDIYGPKEQFRRLGLWKSFHGIFKEIHRKEALRRISASSTIIYETLKSESLLKVKYREELLRKWSVVCSASLELQRLFSELSVVISAAGDMIMVMDTGTATTSPTSPNFTESWESFVWCPHTCGFSTDWSKITVNCLACINHGCMSIITNTWTSLTLVLEICLN